MMKQHETESCRSRRAMNLHAVGVRLWVSEGIPIGLMLGHVMAKPGDERLAKPFHLSIVLRMIDGCRQMWHL